MSKFKVGDHVETLCDYKCPSCIYLQGVVAEVSETNGQTLYKVNWDPTWQFTDEELKLEEEYNGN